MLALSIGEEVDRRYRIVREIGRGGVGIVYEAVRVPDGLRCALKIAHGEVDADVQRGRLQLEAEIGLRLAGEHVVGIYDHGFASERPELYYVAMELLSGADLGELVEKQGPLAPDFALVVLTQLAQVLERAHAAGLVHRDLKPSNLFWHEPDGAPMTLKVLDFGLVKQLERAMGGSTRLTATGAIVGTPDFMAPEQASQAHLIGPHTDIWAVGMVAVYLLTGERYWRGGSLLEVLTQLNAGPTFAPSSRWPHLSSAFDEWFWRSCDRVGARRYASAAAQLSALARVMPTLRDAPAPKTAAATSEDRTMAIYPAQLRALPRPRAMLLGRSEELKRVGELLGDGDARLVSLVGVGGTGKTRLAVEAAAELSAHRKDGVFFVELAAVRSLDALPGALQQSLNVAVEPGESPLAAVERYLQPLDALLLLDNVEHLTNLAAIVVRLLANAPSLRVLVTSRQPLGVEGEARIEVAPLPVPPAGREVGEAQLRAYAAARLFEQRAMEARPGFEITDQNAEAIAEIVRRVDGLPLAIELAAARVRLFTPEELCERLSRRLGILTGTAAPSSERHATMRAAIDWSYALLDETQQRAFRAMSHFPGGATLTSLAEVLACDELELAAAVEQVADQSLCRIDAERRLTQLEVVREYGLERANEDERQRLRERLLTSFLALAERAEPELRGKDQLVWLDRLDREQDNLRAALEAAIALDDGDAALQLATNLAWYWYLRGQYAEGRRWLEQAIAAATTADERSSHSLRVLSAQRCLGELAYLQCDYETAKKQLVACQALARSIGDLIAEADATQALGSMARERGDYDAAARLHAEALAVFMAHREELKAARAYNYLAFAAWLSGDVWGARRHALTAEASFGVLADEEGAIWVLLNLGCIDFFEKKLEDAAARINAAHQRSRTAGFKEGIAWTLHVLGWIALERRQLDEAKETLQESLSRHRTLGDLWRAASVIESLAALSAAGGNGVRGSKLLGIASSIRRRIGTPVPRCEQSGVDETRNQCRMQVGAELARLHEAGAAMPLDAAIRFALE